MLTDNTNFEKVDEKEEEEEEKLLELRRRRINYDETMMAIINLENIMKENDANYNSYFCNYQSENLGKNQNYFTNKILRYLKKKKNKFFIIIFFSF